MPGLGSYRGEIEMCIRVESEPLSDLSMPSKVSPFYQQLIRSSTYDEELKRAVEISQKMDVEVHSMVWADWWSELEVPGCSLAHAFPFSMLKHRN